MKSGPDSYSSGSQISDAKSLKKQIKAVLNLELVLAQFSRISADPSQISGYQFILRLTRGSRYTDVYLKDEEHVQAWRTALRCHAIFSDIHQLYEAGDMLGEGSFGKVFVLSRKSDGRKYAVKAISKRGLLGKASSICSLIQEIQIHRKMSHPNIAQFIEVHETNGTVYLVLELVESGAPLLDLEDCPIIPKKERLSYLRQIAQVLSYVAQQGIIHRDIKPDNIMVRQDGQIKVIDFGLSAPTSSKTAQLRKVGTPGFLAPEIINKRRGGRYGCAVDIYALGVTYYCMVAGEHPFDGVDCQAVLMNNQIGSIDYEHPEIAGMGDAEKRLLQ